MRSGVRPDAGSCRCGRQDPPQLLQVRKAPGFPPGTPEQPLALQHLVEQGRRAHDAHLLAPLTGQQP